MEELTISKVQDLDEPDILVDQVFWRIRDAKVVWLNKDAIQSHFGDSLRSSAALNTSGRDKNIADFIIRNAGLISDAQLRGNDVNGKIEVVGEAVHAHRPPRYGRAAVITMRTAEGRPVRFADLKGCGVQNGVAPHPEFHSTGLLSLVEAIKEVVTQKIIDTIFSALGVDVKGVELYALVYCGFWFNNGRATVPAGMILRSAHRRPKGNQFRFDRNSEEHRAKLKIEFLLRLFGMTSAHPRGRFRVYRHDDGLRCSLNQTYLPNVSPARLDDLLKSVSAEPPFEFDVVNVQMARDPRVLPLRARLVDFGHYSAVDGLFVTPVIGLVEGRKLTWGDVIDPGSGWWRQRDPLLSASFTELAEQECPSEALRWLGVDTPKRMRGADIFSYALADDIVNNRVSAGEVGERITEFVRSATLSARLWSAQS